ncbi:MAG: PrsW family intramembrane metalloprotease [Solobacterium sp.]|nr:PrsW family intramembrane metalloprotease [Solobacterium sp.]
MILFSLAVSFFLYWLILQNKKNDPFPKGGVLRLVIAGTVSVLLATILTFPIGGIIMMIRFGVFRDISIWMQAAKEGSEALAALAQETVRNHPPTFFANLINMFFSAGLLEEGLKYLTCRIAVRKEGMIRTWMDCAAVFAVVGITFEMLENVLYGAGSSIVSIIARALAPAHFAFGVVMGYFYGKYLISKQKKYRLLSVAIPVALHTLSNAFAMSMDLGPFFHVLGTVSGISRIVFSLAAVIIVIRWQKNRTLDIPIDR